MKKKKNGWKIAFIVLLVVIVVIAAWWFFGGDEDDYYEDDYYGYDTGRDNTESSVSATSSTTTSTDTNTAETADPMEFDGLIRSPQSQIKGNGEDTVTIFVYMNGSNLESDDGEATTDLEEMIAAGGSDKVNILVETVGTKSWNKKLGIASDRSQIWCINKDGFNLVKDDMGQLDCTVASTLKDFITWGASNYPADRYILQFWNHGGGPVYGFGYDEFAGEYDALTIDEIQTALRSAGLYFDFIGMDCCIMSSLEVCCALYDFCDYTILSEDFESGLGWSYTTWLKKLYANTSITIPELGTSIVDSMIEANEEENEAGILAVLDEGMMKILYSSWTNFAYANEDSLLGSNYSEQKTRALGGRVSPILLRTNFFSDWMSDGSDSSDDDATMSEYYVTDIMAVAQNVDSDESTALSTALAKAIVYMKATSADSSMTGISVTLPYGDSEFYSELETVFTNCGFESEYITWLEKFTSASGSSDFYDYDSWDDSWSGWDDYEDDYDWSDDDWSLFDFIFGGDEGYDEGPSAPGGDDYGWNDWDYSDSYNDYYDDGYGDYDDWNDSDNRYDDWIDDGYDYGNWDW